MAKLHFTKLTLELILPGERTLTFSASNIRGLSMLVTPNGVKTFYFTRKVLRKVVRIKLGRFPEFNLPAAKKKASKLHLQYDLGMSPAEAIRKERAQPTLNEFFELFYTNHCLRRNKRPEIHRYLYERHIKPVLGSTLISKIQRRDINVMLMNIGNRGLGRTANKVHSNIRVILNKALAWEYLTGDNPARFFERYPEKSRDRFMNKEELERFHVALQMEPDKTNKDCIYTLMLTGARRMEAFSMRWVDVNLEERVWRIPDTKNGLPRLVIIPKELVAILGGRRRDNAELSQWVFPGRGATGHLVDVKKTWNRILDRAGIEDLWLHDLRRTLASWMLADGNDLTTIGKVLGHKDYKSTLVYARLDIESIRKPVENTTSRMVPTLRSIN